MCSKLELVRFGVDKWQSIKSGEILLSMGQEVCGLCWNYHVVGKMCVDCPLSQVGYGCLEQGSVWKRYDAWVDDIEDTVITKLDSDKKEVVGAMIDEMISALEKAERLVLSGKETEDEAGSV
jgi:hypothetical protein